MSEVSEVRLESSWTLGDLLAGIIIEECELRNYIIKIREEWWKCSPRSRIRYKNSRTSVCLRPQWAQKRNWTSIILECRCVTLRTRFLMHFSRSDHCRNFSSCSVAGSSAGAVLWAAVRALGATYQGQNRLKRNQKGKMLSRKKPDMRWPHFLMQMGKLTNWHWLYGKSYLPIALTINLMTYHINLHYRVFVLHYQHLQFPSGLASIPPRTSPSASSGSSFKTLVFPRSTASGMPSWERNTSHHQLPPAANQLLSIVKHC